MVLVVAAVAAVAAAVSNDVGFSGFFNDESSSITRFGSLDGKEALEEAIPLKDDFGRCKFFNDNRSKWSTLKGLFVAMVAEEEWERKERRSIER